MDVNLEIRTESIAAAPRVNIDEARTSRYGSGKARKEKKTEKEQGSEGFAYRLDLTDGRKSRLSMALGRLSPEQMGVFQAGIMRGYEKMNQELNA